MEINRIFARQILDSRGTPTVEADVHIDGDIVGRAAVPSGASTGIHEAHELRDETDEFGGKGVSKAVNYVNTEINEELCGTLADDQFLIDQKLIALDGTDDKSRLGANAILAVSLAAAHAAANKRNLPLYSHINDIAQQPSMSIPMPMMNVLNGGKHASNSSDFQEYMIIPVSANSYSKAVQVGAEIFMALKNYLTTRSLATSVGDEGGFTFEVQNNTQMLDVLTQACSDAGYIPGKDVQFALDIAASEFLADGNYHLATEDLILNGAQMTHYISELKNNYPLASVEDGLGQDSWSEWEALTDQLGNNLQLVGDDLFVTNTSRLQEGINRHAANAILIKPNQIGTLTETIKTIDLAKSHGWNTIVSHRSGETEDVTIAHLAVGTGAGQIKTGSLSRSERTAKHNELMRIEEVSGLEFVNPFAKNS